MAAKKKAEKKPKRKPPGKAKPKKAEFNRPELEALLTSIAEVSPQGAGTISEAQYAAIKQNLDKYFGEEPATIPGSDNPGESDDV